MELALSKCWLIGPDSSPVPVCVRINKIYCVPLSSSQLGRKLAKIEKLIPRGLPFHGIIMDPKLHPDLRLSLEVGVSVLGHSQVIATLSCVVVACGLLSTKVS